MSLLSAKDKFENEQQEREEAWKLLRNIPEYKEDYELTVRLSAKKTKSNLQKIKEIEEKWGFGTLENPEKERPNFELLNFFSDYNPEVSRNNSTVDFGDLKHFYRKGGVIYDPNDNACNEPESPSEVTVKIDIEAPIGAILEELKSGLKHIKALYDIPKKNTPSHDHLTFLVHTLQDIGLNKSEIIDRLTPDEKKIPPYNPKRREARRKEITRCFKQT